MPGRPRPHLGELWGKPEQPQREGMGGATFLLPIAPPSPPHCCPRGSRASSQEAATLCPLSRPRAQSPQAGTPSQRCVCSAGGIHKRLSTILHSESPGLRNSDVMGHLRREGGGGRVWVSLYGGVLYIHVCVHGGMRVSVTTGDHVCVHACACGVCGTRVSPWPPSSLSHSPE